MLLSLRCPLHFIRPRTIYSFPLSFVFLLHRAVATILILTFPSNLSDCRSRRVIRYSLSWTFSNRIQCTYVCTDFGFLFIYKVLIFQHFISDQRKPLLSLSFSVKFQPKVPILVSLSHCGSTNWVSSCLGILGYAVFFLPFFLYMCMIWIWLLSDLDIGQLFMFFCLLTLFSCGECSYIYICHISIGGNGLVIESLFWFALFQNCDFNFFLSENGLFFHPCIISICLCSFISHILLNALKKIVNRDPITWEDHQTMTRQTHCWVDQS